MAEIIFVNPRFEVSYWGLEHALPLLHKRANLPTACLPLLAAFIQSVRMGSPRCSRSEGTRSNSCRSGPGVSVASPAPCGAQGERTAARCHIPSFHEPHLVDALEKCGHKRASASGVREPRPMSKAFELVRNF